MRVSHPRLVVSRSASWRQHSISQSFWTKQTWSPMLASGFSRYRRWSMPMMDRIEFSPIFAFFWCFFCVFVAFFICFWHILSSLLFIFPKKTYPLA